MEATPAPPTSPEPAPSPGELILRTGRLGGTRKPLSVPLTSIGSQPGCDVRLHVEGVEELHCVIVCGPQGLVLRDLQSQAGTFVNGERIHNRQLCDGDLLTVGPFEFQVQINPAFLQSDLLARTLEPPQVVPPAQALHTQAAAVAAQQSALGEEEARLLQQRQALEQQEQQLADHLEAKRKRLLQLTEQAQSARSALQNDRTAHQEQVEQARRRLHEAQARLEETRRQAEAERVRFRALRRRLKERWRRHLQADRQAFRRREDLLADEARQLAKEARHIREAQHALTQARLQWNGEAEVGRRQLHDERDKLAREQQLWQEARRREQEEGARRRAELDRWETDLADLERRLAVEGQRGQKLREEREKEAEGLEHRIRNLRRKLGEQEEALARLQHAPRPTQGDAPADPPTARPARALPSFTEEIRQRQAALEALTAELDDQRMQLLEIWQTLAQTEQSWQRERADVLAELEALGGRFQEREQDLRLREEVLKTQEDLLRQQRDESIRLRQQLESGYARFRARQADWEGERDRLLTEVQGREQLAEQQLAGLVDLRQRWVKRRRQEVQAIQAQRAQYDKLRHEAAALRKEWLARTASLEDQQRAIAEQALALEQHRQETLAQAPDVVAVEKALEKHRRRWLNDNAAALRSLAQQRQALQAETARLDERLRELQRLSQALHAEEAEFSERRVVWEHEQVVAHAEQIALRLEVERSRQQRETYERQLAQLRDEVDRIAEVMLNEGAGQADTASPLAA